MKHKLRNQIAVIFIGMIMIALVIIGLINAFFLENYYVSRKEEVLKEAFAQLESIDLEEEEEETGEEDTQTSELYTLSSENNLTWVMADFTDLNQVRSNSRDRDREQQLLRLFGYTTGLETNNNKEILEETDYYTIQKSQDKFAKMDYIELWGTLDNGNSCLIRSPLESIRESASISNRFFVYVGILVAIFSGLVIWLITKKITRPIMELADISQKMSNLDFDTKYNSRANNEIDQLGENFNSMSEQLKETITELKQANLELEADIADKIKIDKMRKEFLDNVSHELKTPIALIQGYAEGLKDNISDDPESREFYCEVITDEAGKMNRMVKQLLTLNQLESGQDGVTIERFDIAALIRGVVMKTDILVRQQEAKVYFDAEEEMFVWADEFKIEEVVTNFLTNAINHLNEHKTIEIKLQKQEKRLRVSVFNTGKPIPEEDLPHIWNKFYKVDKARTREYGGSGIGLSIVKAIMESHHQQCGVLNHSNGVEFWFELNCDSGVKTPES